MDQEFYLDNNLKLARAESGLTQQETADLVGVSRQTIIAIEKGDYVPSALLAFSLANALNKDVNKIFYLSKIDQHDETGQNQN